MKKTKRKTSPKRAAPQLVICLGAHRSGTSLVAAAIEAAGAVMAHCDAAPSDENPKGFFEHQEVVALDDQILSCGGSAWDDPTFDIARLIQRNPPELAGLRATANAIVARDWRTQQLAAVKDPRLCRLLPFWLPELTAQGYEARDVRFVVVTRDPVEVAVSQRRRCGTTPEFYNFGRSIVEGMALWCSHLRDALDVTIGHPTLIVSYGDFMARPAQHLAALADFMGTSISAEAQQRFSAEFVDGSLWRSHANADDLAEAEAAFPGLLAAEQSLAALSGQVVADDALSPIRAELNHPSHRESIRGAAADAYGRLSDLRRAEARQASVNQDILQCAAAESDELRKHAANLEGDIASQRRQISELAEAASRARQTEAESRGRTQQLETELTSLRTEQANSISTIAAQLGRYGAENDRLNAELASATEALTATTIARTAAEAAAEQALLDARSLLEDANAERARLAAELAAATSAIFDAVAAHQATQAELVEAAAEQNRLSADLAMAGDDLADVQARLDAASGEWAGQVGDLAQQLREEQQRSADLVRQAEVSEQALNDKIIEIHRANEYLVSRNDALRRSTSWRLTAPVRATGAAIRGTKAIPKAGLRGLNRASQISHKKLRQSHPQTADLLRRALQPFLTKANMQVLGQYHVMTPAQNHSVPSGEFAFSFQRPQIHDAYRPLLSVIVPNYNHAPYLRQRLDSILGQTYQNIEILLLDDCSTDESREILAEYAERYPDKVRQLLNDVNSGGVFYQWEKGIAAARGDLIWIAESDDWASPNFLETLVPFFQNEAVQLAYARTIFMDATGENQIWSMEEYLNEFGPERWAHSWVETAPDIVRDVFSMTNIIPNASSAIFRRFERLDALEIDAWRGMKTCGDWMFYLNAIRGGMIAYSPDAQNFYRIHPKNTSVTSHKNDQFYKEHEDVALCLRRHYRVPAENLARMERNLRHHWKLTRSDYSDAGFVACFNPRRILTGAVRKPAILMASYGFCAGGGETFPIILANELKAIGHEVTFLDCAQEERVAGVRGMLANDIPVVSNVADLKRILEHFDIDLVHSHHGWVDNTVLDLLPVNSSARTIVTLHGFYETVPSEQLKVILPRLIDRTGGLVYTAKKNLDAIRNAGLLDKREVSRIDNALSKTPVKPIDRAEFGIQDDAFLLTIVSRAMASKGWREAVDAVTLAREVSGADIQLMMIGEGDARDALLAGPLPNFVHLEPFRQNIRDYFAASDLGFLPTRFPGESFPLVVIDSLNAGTPVLASDIGEIRYMLSTPQGLAGEVFSLSDDWQIDTAALGQLIAELAADPDRIAQMRDRVRDASEQFDPKRMAAKYAAVYSETASRRK